MANNFKVDASRDLSFVKFEIVATAQDEAAMKSDIASLIGDFSKATDNGVFLSENGSDTGLDNEFQYKNFVNKEIADEIYTGNKNDIIGPYKDKGFFKLSKITEVIEMPDSVKASHILVPFVGAQRVAADITRTEEQAEKLADSILTVVKNSVMELKIAVDAKDIKTIEVGKKANIFVPELNKTYIGKVSEINLSADSQTKKYDVKLPKNYAIPNIIIIDKNYLNRSSNDIC